MNPLRRLLRRGMIVGLLLVALAGIVQPQAAQATHACVVPDNPQHRGLRICETMPARVQFDGRTHLFVVGTDWGIWFSYQRWRGGPWSVWYDFGGEAFHNPPNYYASPIAYVDESGNMLTVAVKGVPFNDWFCKRYLRGQGWGPWHRC
jgi:hypothetical protein